MRVRSKNNEPISKAFHAAGKEITYDKDKIFSQKIFISFVSDQLTDLEESRWFFFWSNMGSKNQVSKTYTGSKGSWTRLKL